LKPRFNDRIDLGLLTLRAGIGLMFGFIHGLPKILAGVTMWRSLGGAFNRLVGISFAPAFWGFAAAAAEFGGGLLLVAGIFFRPVLALMLFTMTIAIASIIRGGYGFSGAVQPFELAIVLVALFVTGPGKFTLPSLLRKTKTSA
jgi:putative oxidoreductase